MADSVRAVPVGYEAVEAAKPALTELIFSLRSSEAVEAPGVVLGWRLLTDAGSPIYAWRGDRSGDPDRLWHHVLSVLWALRSPPRRRRHGGPTIHVGRSCGARDRGWAER